MPSNRSVLVELRAQVGSYIAGIQNARRATHDMLAEATRDTKQNNANLQQLGRTGLIVGGVIAAGLGIAIKQFAEFDKAMSNVKAVTSATAAEMNRLRQAAIEAGAATVFNAKDAADAEGELAKAGVAVQDILHGGLTGALNLAAAGQLGVADAANIAATAMVQFGKKGADVPHIADLLAAAANKAQGGVQDMATALKYVGPIAHQMGVSLEETTGAIAELANNGILADQAGTDLRGVLSALTSPSQIAAKQIAALGINVYNAQGNFVGFAGVAQQLQTHLGTLSNAERDQALGRIFGNAQITAARILYAGGAADVNKWTKAVNDDGAAARIAHTNLDNLAGDFEQLKGSLQTALIGQGSAGNSVLRDMAQAATAATNAIGTLPGPVQKAGFFTAALSSGALLTVGALGSLIPKVRNFRTELEGLGRGGQIANRGVGVLGTVGKYAAGITATVIAVTALNEAMRKGPTAVNTTTKALLGLSDSGSDEALKKLGLSFSEIDQSVERIVNPSHVARTRDFFNSFVGGSGDLNDAKDAIGSVDAALSSLVSSGHGPAAEAIFNRLADHGNQFGVSTADLTQALPKYQDALDGVASSAQLADGSSTGAAGAINSVAQSAADAAAAVKQYKDALTDTTAIDAYTATAQTSQAFKDLTKNLKDGGVVTDAEKIKLGDFASQVKQNAAALNANGASQKKVNATLSDGRQKFIQAAEAAGYGADEAKRLAHNLLVIPKRTDVNVNTSSITDANHELRILIGLLAQAGVSKAVGRGIAGKVANNPGLQDTQHRASGGPFRPGPLLVGEQGPELLWASTPGTVTNAAQTQRILGGGTGTTINNGNRTGVHLEAGAVQIAAGTQADAYAIAGQAVRQLSDEVWMRGGWDPA